MIEDWPDPPDDDVIFDPLDAFDPDNPNERHDMSDLTPEELPEEQPEDETGTGKQEFFSTSEVADRFGVTTPTIRDWIERGELPAIKVGTRFMVSRDDMIAMAKSKYAV